MNLYGYAGGDPVNQSDPFGLCAEVIVNGKDVQINAQLQFIGPGWGNDATAVRNAIAAAWSGSRGGYNVTVNLSTGPVVDVYWQDPAKDVNEGSSHGMQNGVAGGGSIYLLASTDGARRARSAAHEFGHVLGLGRNSLQSGNLMNENFIPTDNAINSKQMREIIKKCGTQTNRTDEGEDSSADKDKGK